MALFGKKDPCAICGGKVKGLLPFKLEGQYICSDCHGFVDLPDGATKHMSVADFRNYMSFREENAKLKEQFQTTQQIDFGLFDTKFMFDTGKRLLCMDKHLNKTIFEGHHIKSFVIMEDSRPIFEGDANGLRCHESFVPQQVTALSPLINSINLRNNMNNVLNRDDQNRPQTDIKEPFEKFNVEIRFEHPYWDIFTADMGGPRFDNERPSISDYLHEYGENLQTMEQLANALMEIAFPNASSAAAAQIDPVEELQRYKDLMDQGVITEEEFTAKKRQLLGI